MVSCHLLQLPDSSDKSVRAAGRGCYCLVLSSFPASRATPAFGVCMKEFSVKHWCGENYDLGNYQAFVSPAMLSRLFREAQDTRASSCGGGQP